MEAHVFEAVLFENSVSEKNVLFWNKSLQGVSFQNWKRTRLQILIEDPENVSFCESIFYGFSHDETTEKNFINMRLKYDALARLNDKNSVRCRAITPMSHTKIQQSAVSFAQVSKPFCIVSEQDSNTTLINSKLDFPGLPSNEQMLIKDARIKHYFRVKTVIPSVMSSFAKNTTTTLATLVIY